MAKVKIPVIGTVGKTIVFDPDATVGATLGVDMFLPDGTVLTLAKLSALLSAADETARAASGNSIFVGSVFLRKGSAPTEPIDDDGQYNFTTGVLTPPSIGGGSDDDWSITVPAGTDPLYVSQGSFEVAGATGIDLTVDWTAPVILASDGVAGSPGGDGDSIFVAQVFLRKGSAPTKPIDDDGAYNFTTNVLTPPSTGGGSADNWSITVPAGSNPLYVVAGSFEVNGVTGTDGTVVWSTPEILASDGATGDQGDDGVASIPDFTPGHIGGVSDFVWTLNALKDGSANVGELRVEGNTFEHPDGTTITTDENPFQINTFFEDAEAGKFYIMFSAADGETRFGGSESAWGDGDTRFISVTWNSSDLWRARNNSGTYFAFTPIATDCIIAVCEKISTVDPSGIETIVPQTSGLAGVDADAVITLTNLNVTNVGLGGSPRRAGMRYNVDGTVDRRTSSYTQVNASTDWVIPNDWAPGVWEIRTTKTGGTVVGSALSTWLDLVDGPHEWRVESTGSPVTATITVSIRRAGGSTLDSSVHVLSAEVTGA